MCQNTLILFLLPCHGFWDTTTIFSVRSILDISHGITASSLRCWRFSVVGQSGLCSDLGLWSWVELLLGSSVYPGFTSSDSGQPGSAVPAQHWSSTELVIRSTQGRTSIDYMHTSQSWFSLEVKLHLSLITFFSPEDFFNQMQSTTNTHTHPWHQQCQFSVQFRSLNVSNTKNKHCHHCSLSPLAHKTNCHWRTTKETADASTMWLITNLMPCALTSSYISFLCYILWTVYESLLQLQAHRAHEVRSSPLNSQKLQRNRMHSLSLHQLSWWVWSQLHPEEKARRIK